MAWRGSKDSDGWHAVREARNRLAPPPALASYQLPLPAGVEARALVLPSQVSMGREATRAAAREQLEHTPASRAASI